jgi:AcrR family transcriptional regulator
VPSQRSSSGDPARTLALLWREPGFGTSTRGPKQALTVDDVVAAAITLADHRGLDSLAMRSVAEALHVAPMSVYTYVPGKAELLDLMLDAVYLAMPRTPFEPGQAWRERVASVAEANRALFAAHPWAATVTTARPPLGPGLMAKYEYELSAFDDLGLPDVTVDDALTWVLTFVQATARSQADVRASALDSALSDEQWWAANAPLLARVFDPTGYPRATRIGTAAGEAHGSAYDPRAAYEFGLARVIDGLAALIDD